MVEGVTSGYPHAYLYTRARSIPSNCPKSQSPVSVASIQSNGQLQNMPYAAKAKSQQFTRRKSNLVKKADQLARLCQADLALIIRKGGRYYTYRSTDHDQWPPIITEIVCEPSIDHSCADRILEEIVPFAGQFTTSRP